MNWLLPVRVDSWAVLSEWILAQHTPPNSETSPESSLVLPEDLHVCNGYRGFLILELCLCQSRQTEQGIGPRRGFTRKGHADDCCREDLSLFLLVAVTGPLTELDCFSLAVEHRSATEKEKAAALKDVSAGLDQLDIADAWSQQQAGSNRCFR